jgi:hypothetical protein
LCVAPLSTNIIEASADLSERWRIPLVLIASRRQIECAELGRGYVNRWSTEEFSRAVRALNRGKLFLARDHGGPGQGNGEEGQSREAWMKAAKLSYAADIESGFDFLQLDTSAVRTRAGGGDEAAVADLLELYGYVQHLALSRGRKITIEVGIEEHSGVAPEPEFLRAFLSNVFDFCRQQKLPPPLFAAAHTGTKVEELRNVGDFEIAEKREHVADQIRAAVAIARGYGCYLKEHSADYLSSPSIALRAELGIRAVNVAPEIGVAETNALLLSMRQLGCEREREEFHQIALRSGCWKKWMCDGSRATDDERVLIAGHYCFSDPAVKELKARVASAARARGLDLDASLRQGVEAAIGRYGKALGIYP